MPRGKTSVIVELTPFRESVTVVGTDSFAERLYRPTASESAESWPERVARFTERLRPWVEELGIEGRPCRVVYQGPDTASSVFDSVASAGAERAAAAARVAMGETLSYPLESNAFNARTVATGRSRDPSETNAGRLWTLVAADTEACLALITTSIESCGLRVDSLVPAQAGALQAAIESLTSTTAAGSAPPRIVLWVGEGLSVIAAGDQGSLALARVLPVGIASLVDALSRPVQQRSSGASCVLLDRESARRLLEASGVPSPSGWNDPLTGLDARAVLPLLQPVLQRLVVETKQSARFGLDASQRAGASLSIVGPGSSIPGLGAVLAAESSLELVVSEVSGLLQSLSGDGACTHAIRSTPLTLEPREAIAARAIRHTRQAVIVGAATVLLGLGVDAGISAWRLTQSNRVLATLGKSGVSLEQLQTERTRSLELRAGVARARSRMQTVLSEQPDWSSLLAVVAERTPAHVRLDQIILDGDTAACTLLGEAWPGDASDCADALTAYADSFADCPLAAAARLGATRRVTRDDREGLAFELTLELVRLPRPEPRLATMEDLP